MTLRQLLLCPASKRKTDLNLFNLIKGTRKSTLNDHRYKRSSQTTAFIIRNHSNADLLQQSLANASLTVRILAFVL
jgi:hypothetical protein